MKDSGTKTHRGKVLKHLGNVCIVLVWLTLSMAALLKVVKIKTVMIAPTHSVSLHLPVYL